MRFPSLLALCALILLVPSVSTLAQDAAPPIDILPAKTAKTKGLMYNTDEITHPELRMTPDKSELVHLEGAAASIIIGNPQHLSIIAESPSLLVLSSRAPGATYFTVLDSKGGVLMQRHVIVSSPKEKYMRVRKSCSGSKDKNCQPTNVYYCPDMCHRILIDDAAAQNSGASAEPAPASSSGEATTEPGAQDTPNATQENGTEP
jgi:hypothetical protein